jgi:hypothetical protein
MRFCSEWTEDALSYIIYGDYVELAKLNTSVQKV